MHEGEMCVFVCICVFVTHIGPFFLHTHRHPAHPVFVLIHRPGEIQAFLCLSETTPYYTTPLSRRLTRHLSRPHPSHQVCTEYASAIDRLTREVSATAAPSPPPRALLVHRDARQPFPPSSQATQPADLEEGAVAAPMGDKDTATGSPVAATGSSVVDSDGSERGRSAVASGANRVAPGESDPPREGQDLELRQGSPSREGLPIGVNASGVDGISATGLPLLEGLSTGDNTVRGVDDILDEMTFDAVLTSPPYPGVYDYLAHARSARSQLGALPRHSLRTSSKDLASGRRPGGRLVADAAVGSGKSFSPDQMEYHIYI